jgi:hypothetical protein
MFPFRRKRNLHPPGSGLTYCAGFDLVVSAEIPTAILIEIEQRRWGGTDVDPPRNLGRHQLQASAQETVVRISTDDAVLGHPCADTLHFTVWPVRGERAELEITEAQGSQAASIVSSTGWTARYPEFEGPNGLRIKYRPIHGYLD